MRISLPNRHYLAIWVTYSLSRQIIQGKFNPANHVINRYVKRDLYAGASIMTVISPSENFVASNICLDESSTTN